jgi:hypothetical protein
MMTDEERRYTLAYHVGYATGAFREILAALEYDDIDGARKIAAAALAKMEQA